MSSHGAKRMRIGGGGREVWIVVVPVAVLAAFVVTLLGGPDRALIELERMFYSGAETVRGWLR